MIFIDPGDLGRSDINRSAEQSHGLSAAPAGSVASICRLRPNDLTPLLRRHGLSGGGEQHEPTRKSRQKVAFQLA